MARKRGSARGAKGARGSKSDIMKKMKKRKKLKKRILAMIVTIIIFDVMLSAIDNYFRLDPTTTAIVAGFTFFAMVLAAYVASQKYKNMAKDFVAFGIVVGVIGLVAQGFFAIAYRMSYGTSYPLIFAVLLASKNIILGLGFGAFAGWLVEKVVR